MTRRRFRIALISPKGPLYRHRGGIFGKSLRYMPLTLPTLAALVPAELDADVVCIDEGIDEAWKQGGQKANAGKLGKGCRDALTSAAKDVLGRLYPEVEIWG